MILNNKKTQILFSLIFAFSLILIFVFAIRNNIKNDEKALVEIKKKIEQQKDYIKILKVDLTNLTKSNRIKKLAKEKLGLEQTKIDQIKQIFDLENGENK
tara:strand:+ start:595 stop:894 length:300 start_codon:yes stop_codon:yes gene_type:complete